MKKHYEKPNVEELELKVESGIAVSEAQVVWINEFNDQEEW